MHERFNLQTPNQRIINTSYPITAIAASNIQKKYDSLVEKYFGEKLQVPEDRNILQVVAECLMRYRAKHTCRSSIICYESVRNMTDWEFVAESTFLIF